MRSLMLATVIQSVCQPAGLMVLPACVLHMCKSMDAVVDKVHKHEPYYRFHAALAILAFIECMDFKQLHIRPQLCASTQLA